jgi:hypothetical protein
MTTQSITEQIRWQDLKVRGEIDIVLEIAKQNGWNDCEIFGYGDMLTEPRESMGWDLIPADLYEHSIPPEAVTRLHQIINAGIRVQGVIIADDQRKVTAPAPEPAPVPAPTPEPVSPELSLTTPEPIPPKVEQKVSNDVHATAMAAPSPANAQTGSFDAVASFAGAALMMLMIGAGAVAVLGLAWFLLTHVLWMAIPLGAVALISACGGTNSNTGASSDYDYDPKLIALVDDGSGRTVWVSLYTWYD